MRFGMLRNSALLVLLRTGFANKLVKGLFLLEHKIVPYSSAPVPIISTVVKVGSEQYQESQEGDTVGGATIVEDIFEAPLLIRVERRTWIQPNRKGVVLVTAEARGPVQVDEKSDQVFMYAWETATRIMDVFTRRPFLFLIIY